MKYDRCSYGASPLVKKNPGWKAGVNQLGLIYHINIISMIDLAFLLFLCFNESANYDNLSTSRKNKLLVISNFF